MSGPVFYSHTDSIAVIRMDDGKVNALGPGMLNALNEAIDQADRDNVGALVITGNERVFSGGFDLKVLTYGEVQPAIDMLRGGFELSYRLLELSEAGGDGVHRTRHRDGGVPAVLGRSPSGRPRLQHSGQRGRDRHGHPIRGPRGHEVAAHTVGLPAGDRAGQGVLRRDGARRRLRRRDLLPEMVVSRAEEAARNSPVCTSGPTRQRSCGPAPMRWRPSAPGSTA